MERNRFVTLDGLRGVAAFAVVIFHRRWLFPDWHVVDHAYLAVDFFFILSGFVLSHAYRERIRNGMSFIQFMRVRLIRLYPLYFLGLVLGALFWLGKVLHHGAHVLDLLIPLASMLLFLPALRPLPAKPDDAFPINSPAWSLSFEMFASILFFYLCRIRSVWMAILCLTAGMWLFWSGRSLGGFDYTNLADGIPRVCFSFFLGCTSYWLFKSRFFSISASRTWNAVGYVVLSAVLLLIFAPSTELLGWNYDIVIIAVVFPVIVYLGAYSMPSGRMVAVASVAGELSYPIYVLHYPILYWLDVIGWLKWAPIYVIVSGSILVAAGVAYFVYKYIDAPVRKFLSKKKLGLKPQLSSA